MSETTNDRPVKDRSAEPMIRIDGVVRTFKQAGQPLDVLRDRGFMRNALERAKAAGCSTLVFTVDMPTPGARYRDAHSGMSGSARNSPGALSSACWNAAAPQVPW